MGQSPIRLSSLKVISARAWSDIWTKPGRPAGLRPDVGPGSCADHLQRAQPDRRLAHEGAVLGDLLPQRGDLLRRRHPGAPVEPIRPAAAGGRRALYRTFGTRRRPRRRPFRAGRHHHLPPDVRGSGLRSWPMIRVLIVDDSATMRARVAAALSTAPEFMVVGEAGEPLAAAEAIRGVSADRITLA